MRKVERELRKLAPHNNGGATDAPPQHKRRRKSRTESKNNNANENSTTKKDDGELAIENQYKLPYQCPQFHHPKADSNSANRGRIHSNALTMTDATGDMMPNIGRQRTKYLVASKCKRQQGFEVIVKTPKSTATVKSKRIYYSGTNGFPDGMPEEEKDAMWKSAPETLHVLGRDDDAFRVIDDEGRFICSRPNRKSHSHKVFSKRSRHAMEAILSKSTTGNAKRSPKKQPEIDLEEGTKYGCVGPSPNRGGRGIVSNVRKLREKTRREINRILTQVEEVISQTISPQQVHIQKKMIGKMELPGFERSKTLTNIAVGVSWDRTLAQSHKLYLLASSKPLPFFVVSSSGSVECSSLSTPMKTPFTPQLRFVMGMARGAKALPTSAFQHMGSV